MKRKVCIYGGSFDPIHTGHAIVAGYVAQWGGFDEVWLMVSRHNPLKEGNPAPDADRLAMAALVADRSPVIKVSDFEMGLPQPSYTYTTLQELRRAYPDCDFSILVGADNWRDFNLWRDSGRIISEFGVVVYPRRGYEPSSPLPVGVVYLADAPLMEISSTFIRNALEAGGDIEFFVPDGVKQYISTHHLYDRRQY